MAGARLLQLIAFVREFHGRKTGRSEDRAGNYRITEKIEMLRPRLKRVAGAIPIARYPCSVPKRAHFERVIVVFLLITIMTAMSSRKAPAATVADLDRSIRYKTAKIEISGVRKFPVTALLSVMATKSRPFYQVWKPLPEFNPEAFADDLKHIKLYYQVHGYYDAEVSYQLQTHDRNVSLYIRIKEGEPVLIALVKVHSRAASTSELDPLFRLPLKVGDVFDQGTYQIGEQNLLDLYTHHSYAHAKVHRHATVNSALRSADVEYEIDPGPRCVFGANQIIGSQKSDLRLIEEQLTFERGQPFDSDKLSESRDAVVGLNLFSAVNFEKDDNPEHPEIVPIRIIVREGPKHRINASVGYNTQTQLNAMIAFNDYNFLGGGRQVSLSGTYSNVVSALDAKLFQPRFFTPGASLTFEASQQEQTYQTYTASISGLDPHLDYKFSPSLTGFVGWRLEYLRFNSVNRSTAAAIGGFRRTGILSGPNVGMTFSDTDDVFDPHAGQIVSILGNLSDHGVGADYRYWRVRAEIRKYQLIGWKTVLASRLEIGLGDTLGKIGDVPLSERLYSGGEGSVRGYGLRRIGKLSLSNDPLGGLSQVEGSIELRRPLVGKLDGAVFIDCGQVATKAYDLRVDAFQCGYGPALSYTTPIGPLRFDLGLPTQRPHGDPGWQFYFSIGQYF